MSEKTLLPFSLALAFLLLSGLDSLGMNGIIGGFIGGLGVLHFISPKMKIWKKKKYRKLWNEEWHSMGWTVVWIVLLILFLRRIPAFLALMPFLLMFRKKTSDILILGWFDPIGVAAMYYAIESKEKTGLEEVWIIQVLLLPLFKE